MMRLTAGAAALKRAAAGDTGAAGDAISGSGSAAGVAACRSGAARGGRWAEGVTAQLRAHALTPRATMPPPRRPTLSVVVADTCHADRGPPSLSDGGSLSRLLNAMTPHTRRVARMPLHEVRGPANLLSPRQGREGGLGRLAEEGAGAQCRARVSAARQHHKPSLFVSASPPSTQQRVQSTRQRPPRPRPPGLAPRPPSSPPTRTPPFAARSA